MNYQTDKSNFFLHDVYDNIVECLLTLLLIIYVCYEKILWYKFFCTRKGGIVRILADKFIKLDRGASKSTVIAGHHVQSSLCINIHTEVYARRQIHHTCHTHTISL